MSFRPRAVRVSFLAAVLSMCVALGAGSHAHAQSCVPVDMSPPADPAESVFEVEGKISSFDRSNRTITANGMSVVLPAGLLVETRDADLGGNISFDQLTDPLLEAQQSIIGGTLIATGDIEFTVDGAGFCVSFEAATVYVEMAENVIVGLLSDIDDVGGTFAVNGVVVSMNTDARFPSDLLDIGGNAITIADMAGFEGTAISVGGYFDPVQGALIGTIVETEVLSAQPGADSVAITRAEGRDGDELRVEGVNSIFPQTGQFATSVDIYTGGLDAAGTACVGTLLGTAQVDQADGSWDLRLRDIASIPANVCAESPLGGVATRAVEID